MADRDAGLREQLLANGYVAIDDAVPASLCADVVAATCAFLGIDRDAPATWQRHAVHGHGIVPLHHHQALWEVRQLPRLHEIFHAIYATPALWVSHDRVSFKAPSTLLDAPFRMDPVHWDGDPRLDDLAVQGLVYLTDTPAERGPLGVVPSLYGNLDAWLARQAPDGGSLRRPDCTGHPLVGVPGRRGTLVIWHRRMPHSSLENRSDAPRIVQYVTMTPASQDAQARETLAAATLEKRPPAWAIRQRVRGQLDPEPGPPVQLSALGRRLAGLDVWPGTAATPGS